MTWPPIIVAPCTWRRCRSPATWVITAGRPEGPAQAALSCDRHYHQITARVERAAGGQRATQHTYRQPTPDPPQLTLDTDGAK